MSTFAIQLPRQVGGFSIIPDWLAARTEISTGFKLFYATIGRLIGTRGYVLVKRDTLAGRLGVVARTIDRFIETARQFGLMIIERTGRASIFALTYHSWMPITEAQARQQAIELPGQHRQFSLPDLKKMSDQIRSQDQILALPSSIPVETYLESSCCATTQPTTLQPIPLPETQIAVTELPGSHHSLAICQAAVQAEAVVNPTIQDPARLAYWQWRTGTQDSTITQWLKNPTETVKKWAIRFTANKANQLDQASLIVGSNSIVPVMEHNQPALKPAGSYNSDCNHCYGFGIRYVSGHTGQMMECLCWQ